MNIFLLAGAVAQTLQVTVVPAQPLLERTLYGQAMNCDFRIANRGSEAIELRVVDLAVRDRNGALIAKLELNDNGIAPGIEIVPNRKLAAGGGMTSTQLGRSCACRSMADCSSVTPTTSVISDT